MNNLKCLLVTCMSFFENSVYFPIPPLWLDCLFLIYLDNLLPNVLLSSLLPFKSCFFTQLTVCFAEAFNFMRFHLLISDLTSWATGKVFICILSVLLTSPFLFCLCICLCLSLYFFFWDMFLHVIVLVVLQFCFVD